MRLRISHLSIDFWNTIATPSKEFAAKRAQMLCNSINNLYELGVRITPAQIREEYTATKKQLDFAAETCGVASTPFLCMESLIYRPLWAEKSPAPLGRINEVVEQAVKQLSELFQEHPPFIDSDLKDIINNYPISVSVGSNTNFIGGELIQKLLESQGFEFAFYIFSDQVGCSKPSAEFFQRVMNKADIDNPSMLYHMGDNQICDQLGPWRAGCRAGLIIDPPDLKRELIFERDT